MEKNNTKAKLFLSLFLMVLLLSGAEGGRYLPDEQSETIANNQQLSGWFGYPRFGWPFNRGWFGYPRYGWPFNRGWFGHFPLKADLSKQNPVPVSTTGDASVAASTVFP